MRNQQRTSLAEILILALFVLAVRILFEGAIPFFQEHFNLNFNDTLIALLRNYPLILLIAVLDFLLVLFLVYLFQYGKRPILRTLCELAGILLIAFISAFLLRAMQPDVKTPLSLFFNHTFWYTVLISIMLNAVIVVAIDLFSYYGRAQEEALNKERLKKNKARYQYQQLKGQLNPHFLFNSLNSLDYLIHTDTDKASSYVRQLSSVYRYMLHIGEQMTVSLKDEMDFVHQYIDLLTQRFDKGLQVIWEVDESVANKMIIPCALQLLVENATKHNVISSSKPLTVRITNRDNMLIVWNNVQPKIKDNDSSGLGLENIKGQYQSLFGKEIQILQTDAFFEVSLPLIEEYYARINH